MLKTHKLFILFLACVTSWLNFHILITTVVTFLNEHSCQFLFHVINNGIINLRILLMFWVIGETDSPYCYQWNTTVLHS